MGTQDVVVGITNAYYIWVSISNTFPNILFQSDNIHISKIFVDKTVHNYALRSLRIACNELYPLMSHSSICSKPSSDIGCIRTIGYNLYR
jgi:hypothetical protein